MSPTKPQIQKQLDDCRTKKAELASDLADANTLRAELETDVREATAIINALKDQLADCQASHNPPPPPPPSGGTFAGLGPQNMPASWRPGSTASPFNAPVNKANVHPKSQAKVDWLISFDDNDTPRGLMDLDIKDRSANGSSAHAICWAKPTDPEFVIHQGVDWFPQTEGLHLRIPPQAEAGQDGYDYQLCVVQPDGTTFEFWQFERTGSNGGSSAGSAKPRNRTGGGEVWCTTCAKSRIDGDLLTDVGSVTQGRFDLPAGQIRGEHMKAGRIPHALFLVVPGSARSGQFVTPTGTNPTTPGTDKVDVGNRFFLNYTAAEIDALPLKAWEKIIYKCYAELGGYVGDGGGADSVLMDVLPLSGSSYAPWAVADPWVDYVKAQGIGVYQGHYVLRWTQGVIDWRSRLKVAA